MCWQMQACISCHMSKAMRSLGHLLRFTLPLTEMYGGLCQCSHQQVSHIVLLLYLLLSNYETYYRRHQGFLLLANSPSSLAIRNDGPDLLRCASVCNCTHAQLVTLTKQIALMLSGKHRPDDFTDDKINPTRAKSVLHTHQH